MAAAIIIITATSTERLSTPFRRLFPGQLRSAREVAADTLPHDQQILKRTQTSQDVLQKLRPTTDDASSTPRPFTAEGAQARDVSRGDAVSLAPSKK